jgi:hypothetical protein
MVASGRRRIAAICPSGVLVSSTVQCSSSQTFTRPVMRDPFFRTRTSALTVSAAIAATRATTTRRSASGLTPAGMGIRGILGLQVEEAKQRSAGKAGRKRRWLVFRGRLHRAMGGVPALSFLLSIETRCVPHSSIYTG